MRIGDLELATNLLLAPIAGYCDVSFRLVVRSIGGVGLACTDLLSPQGILRGTDRSMQLAATCPEDQPLCVQLFGYEPEIMADAAAWAQQHGARIIDINMGCPADKVVKRGGGVALMGDTSLATRIAAAVVKAVTVPVTAKMRLGLDGSELVAPRLARMLVEVGIRAVTVHGRTAEQRFRGNVDQEGIAAVVRAVGDIPVIGNGDIKSPQDAADMIDRTGCTGVMIGRRALADPWIFRDTHAYQTTGEVPAPPRLRERVDAIVQHFENLRRFSGDRTACVRFRQRISWYARMLPRSKRLRGRMNQINTPGEFYEIVTGYLEEHGA